jgi:hypothetical protein
VHDENTYADCLCIAYPGNHVSSVRTAIKTGAHDSTAHARMYDVEVQFSLLLVSLLKSTVKRGASICNGGLPSSPGKLFVDPSLPEQRAVVILIAVYTVHQL